jgi:hypothetical protein
LCLGIPISTCVEEPSRDAFPFLPPFYCLACATWAPPSPPPLRVSDRAAQLCLHPSECRPPSGTRSGNGTHRLSQAPDSKMVKSRLDRVASGRIPPSQVKVDDSPKEKTLPSGSSRPRADPARWDRAPCPSLFRGDETKCREPRQLWRSRG